MAGGIYQRQVPGSFKTAHRTKSARYVPVLVRLSILFVNIWGLMGITFSSVGLLASLLFLTEIDFVSPFHFGKNTAESDGIVWTISATGASVNKKRVYAYKFHFTSRGNDYEGISYSHSSNLDPADHVVVEYDTLDPSIARIKGMRVKPFGIHLSFVFLFPMIGILFLVLSVKKGIPQVQAVRYGVLTRGILYKSVPTGGKINNREIYDMYFRFTDQSGTERNAIGSTHKTELLEDEAQERIVYDPDNPGNAVVVDAMPGRVRKFIDRNIQ